MEVGTVEWERQRRRERAEEGRAREQDKRLVQMAGNDDPQRLQRWLWNPHYSWP